MEDLLLSRQNLDEMENNPIFTLWLYGSVDESHLTDEEKQIIFARQMYYDLLILDGEINYLLNHLRCDSLEELANDSDKITIASLFLVQKEDVVRTKVLLMKKRQDKEKVLKMKENK